MNRWTSRTTIFAIAILCVGSVALFLHDMTGGEYVALCGCVHSFIVIRALGEDFKPKDSSAGTDAQKG